MANDFARKVRQRGNLTWQWGWYAVLVCGCILLLPRLFAWGMFLDGITYATISRNLSIGLGTWWQPYYTATLYPQFYEQPPLGLIVQSLFFKLAGDHFLVEKAYCLMVVLISAWLVVLCWQQLSHLMNQCAMQRLAWLPVLIWVLVPKWAWAYSNNILENTMTVFCLLAFLGILRALRTQRLSVHIVWSVFAGLALTCAALTKGPPGLFPFIAPIVLAGFFSAVSARRAVTVMLVISLVLGV